MLEADSSLTHNTGGIKSNSVKTDCEFFRLYKDENPEI